MNLFYHPSIEGNLITLNQEESAHCIRVLRLTVNDIIDVTNGKGKIFRSKIVKPDKKACVVEIIETNTIVQAREFSLHIAIAPTKSNDRLEWFIEKSTEIGIDKIIPLICHNSERKTVKRERLEKVAISAMKQSLKAVLPVITDPVKFEMLVTTPSKAIKYIATASESSKNNLKTLYSKGSDVLVLIGPEGDFTEEELELANSQSFTPVNLGRSRLRTETAGVVVCSSINLLNY